MTKRVRGSGWRPRWAPLKNHTVVHHRKRPLALFGALLARSLAGFPTRENGNWDDGFSVS